MRVSSLRFTSVESSRWLVALCRAQQVAGLRLVSGMGFAERAAAAASVVRSSESWRGRLGLEGYAYLYALPLAAREDALTRCGSTVSVPELFVLRGKYSALGFPCPDAKLASVSGGGYTLLPSLPCDGEPGAGAYSVVGTVASVDCSVPAIASGGQCLTSVEDCCESRVAVVCAGGSSCTCGHVDGSKEELRLQLSGDEETSFTVPLAQCRLVFPSANCAYRVRLRVGLGEVTVGGWSYHGGVRVTEFYVRGLAHFDTWWCSEVSVQRVSGADFASVFSVAERLRLAEGGGCVSCVLEHQRREPVLPCGGSLVSLVRSPRAPGASGVRVEVPKGYWSVDSGVLGGGGYISLASSALYQWTGVQRGSFGGRPRLVVPYWVDAGFVAVGTSIELELGGDLVAAGSGVSVTSPSFAFPGVT